MSKIVVICLCSVAAAVLLAAIGCLWYFFGMNRDNGLIFNNITAAGINLGGMTPEQAAQALHQATDQTYTRMDMVVRMPDCDLTLSPADTGAKLDVDAVVAEAFNYGRTGTRSENEAARAALESGSYPIALLPYLSLNTDYIRATLEEYGRKFNSTRYFTL